LPGFASFLWDCKAQFYRRAKTIPPVRWIVNRELDNVGLLLAQSDPPDLDQAGILDLATGNGAILDLLPESNTVVALDRSHQMLKVAKIRHPKVKYVVADVNKLPFRAEAFALLTAVGLLEYLRTPARFIRELSRVAQHRANVVLTWSPVNLINLLRFGFGHRLYFTTFKKLLSLCGLYGLTFANRKDSLLQGQVLFSIDKEYDV
jgi:SAM-dependent methyltransferase